MSTPITFVPDGEDITIDRILAVTDRVLGGVNKDRKGGPGSGNFGHAGRPGQIGGSAPDEGGEAAKPGGGSSASHDFGKATPAVRTWAERKFGDATKAAAFCRWFGESKVVDEKGEPLVVYHGTPTPGWNEFDPTGRVRGEHQGGSFFASDNPVQASDYAYDPKQDPKISEINTRLGETKRDLMEAHSRGDKESFARLREQHRQLTDDLVQRLNSPERQSHGGAVYSVFLSVKDPLVVDAKGQLFLQVNEKAIKDAKEQGRDGAIIKGVIDPARVGSGPQNVYVAFKATQLKSATGNTGTFDPTSPDIRKSPLAIRGGPGSGNFGHAGRPGEVGGSASDGGEGLSGESQRLTIGEIPNTGNFAKDTREYLTRILPAEFKVYRKVWLAADERANTESPGLYWAETPYGAKQSGYAPQPGKTREVILEADAEREHIDVDTSIARRRRYGEPEISFATPPSNVRVYASHEKSFLHGVMQGRLNPLALRKSWLREAGVELWTKAERQAEKELEAAALRFLARQRREAVAEVKRIADEQPQKFTDAGNAESIADEAYSGEDWDKALRLAVGEAIARTVVRGYLAAQTVQAGRRRRFAPPWATKAAGRRGGVRYKGGPGSGNFGHAGIPGHLGGSAAGEEGAGDIREGGGSVSLSSFTSQTEFQPSHPKGSTPQQLGAMGQQIEKAISDNPRRTLDPLWGNKGEELVTYLTSQGPITRPATESACPREYGIASAHSHANDEQPMNHEDVALWLRYDVKKFQGRVSRLITYHNNGDMEVLEITPATKVSGLRAPKSNEFWDREQGMYSRESMLRGISKYAEKHGLAFHVTKWKQQVAKHNEYLATKAVYKGGPGSGNFGHAGRPGMVGGSAEGEGGGAEAKPSDDYGKASSTVQSWARQKFGSDEKAAAFCRWFGESKVVNERGEPLVVYHGTTAVFAAFDEARRGSNQESLKHGFFLSTDPDEAAAYAEGTGGNIIPAYVSIQNPLVERYEDKDTPPALAWENMKASRMMQAIKDGRDGIIIDNGRHQLVVPFKPAQIKSATGNVGTFDPSSPDIRKSHKQGWADAPLTEDEEREVMSFRLPPSVTRRVFETVGEVMRQPYWKDINDVGRERMRWSIHEGIEEGKTLDQIVKDIEGDVSVDEVRARRIATTESNNAIASGHWIQAKEAEDAGVPVTKTWTTVGDDKVRQSHQDMDGTVVEGADGLFDVEGVLVPWPGHVDLPPENRISCRCQCVIDALYPSETVASHAGAWRESRAWEKGGPGSGNFGHAGIPGHLGGSAPAGEGGGAAGKKTERWGVSDDNKLLSKFKGVDSPEIKATALSIMRALPTHVSRLVAERLETINVANDSRGNWAASYGAGKVSINIAKYINKTGGYSTWDGTYKEYVVHTIESSLYHEFGHVIHGLITKKDTAFPELKETWEKTSGIKQGDELESLGVSKVRVELPEALSHRREFKPGGLYDWQKVGWTYDGYKRINEAVQWDYDASGRIRNLQVIAPVARTTYVPKDQKPPTGYGTGRNEEFAEAFKLYHVQPDVLRARRQDMFDWMDQWHNSKS